MQLNPRQHAAVQATQGPVLVLAGAGSGKTKVITEKIAHLIETIHLPPKTIYALTFTNKAAKEMKERLKKRLSNARGLHISTFHTLGLKIIRQEHLLLGYSPNLSLFDPTDVRELMTELVSQDERLSLLDLEYYQWQIGQWKNAGCDAEHVTATQDPRGPQAHHLYTDYQRCLKAYNAVDFDDLILLPLLLFKKHPEAQYRWQQKIQYLLVDEYQDTNACQYALIKSIVERHQNFTVVGDDDQSIYTWRGACPKNLHTLQEDFPSLQLIKLEQNYRSTGTILTVANELISQNTHLFEKKLWSTLGPGDPVRVLCGENDDGEAERIVTDLLAHQFQKRSAFSDYAILYRGNYQARPFEQALRRHRVPYRLTGGTSFFARTEIKDLMSYLRLLLNSDDDVAFLRCVNTPRREIGPKTLMALGEYAQTREISLIAACQEAGLSTRLSQTACDHLQQFAHFISKTRDYAEHEPLLAIQELLKAIDYTHWLAQNASTPKALERQQEHVNAWLGWIQRLLETPDNDIEHFDALVSQLSLYDLLEQQTQKEDANEVQLMTLHAAKGLEFPFVYVVGIEEELLPHRTSIDEDTIEEERRLCYVGITRAQKELTLCYANERQRQGEKIKTTPSRFLSELPESELTFETPLIDKTPEERKKTGQQALDHLRQLLTSE